MLMFIFKLQQKYKIDFTKLCVRIHVFPHYYFYQIIFEKYWQFLHSISQSTD